MNGNVDIHKININYYMSYSDGCRACPSLWQISFVFLSALPQVVLWFTIIVNFFFRLYFLRTLKHIICHFEDKSHKYQVPLWYHRYYRLWTTPSASTIVFQAKLWYYFRCNTTMFWKTSSISEILCKSITLSRLIVTQ